MNDSPVTTEELDLLIEVNGSWLQQRTEVNDALVLTEKLDLVTEVNGALVTTEELNLLI